MYKFKEEKMNVPCYIWSEQGSIEQGAIDQIKNASSLPFVFHHTALMADAHQGYGVSIGSVVALKDVICPSMVGVDIGCGMCAVKTSLTDINVETLKKIMGEIRKLVPVGFEHHAEEQDVSLMPSLYSDPMKQKEIVMPIIKAQFGSALRQLGTLGGGNHFIEIQKGSDGHIWIMIHSGSRNLGKKVADHYNNIAKNLNEKWHTTVPKKWDLAFLPMDSEEGQAYLREMQYCVDFALANRQSMMHNVLTAFSEVLFDHNVPFAPISDAEPMINIAHNYAKMENHFGQNVLVHRKGATLASSGNIGIIPGSQGTKSYIVRGLGNPDSFNSCSHGAGRKMGRAEARKTLNLASEKAKLDDMGVLHAMRGEHDLDEAPGAYKAISEVMANQSDLVGILVELTPLAVIKA